ncbi:hypothetical protein AX16_009206 [Volvariella volvacea WC 439]|nr:hypothetical protein AX16_009206 [Volvariella volvacea WC 439]
MICSKTVFRCFKKIERWGDRLTGAAGKYFVMLAIVLLALGTACFFDIILPSMRYPMLSGPICALIALNLHMHYYYACTVPPGYIDDPPPIEGTGILWARRKGDDHASSAGVRWTENDVMVTQAGMTQCRKCLKMRPERAHHCRICNRCVLKYDHHCPVRINQCVGIHNERHFVMFMAYMVLSTLCFSVLGYSNMLDALGLTSQYNWEYHMPQVAFVLMYILSAVLCLCVAVMLLYHLYGISCGETSVEAQDHEVYRAVAKDRGDQFINSYDLGKRKNLQLFFNIGPDGYPLYTLILPLRILPYTDGRAWARRAGYERHHGIRRGEEMTDEDDDDD